MPISKFALPGVLIVALFGNFSTWLCGQEAGIIEGRVLLEARNTPIHNATVFLVQLQKSEETDDAGYFRFSGVPPGLYDLVAQTAGLSSEMQSVQVQAGATATVDFLVRVSPIREEITVTASPSGAARSSFSTVQSITTVDSIELSQRSTVSLGDALEQEPGVAKRSFGPGSSRPVIRGFDGDRVLILKNGLPSGALSSQSGDHGESIDLLSLDRIEILRGPATLLYGSNALGGVVNAIDRHELHGHPHDGIRGFSTGGAGSANGLAAGSGGIEFGTGNWLLWASGGGQRTGDYQTPAGSIENSSTRRGNAGAGLGWFAERGFFSVDYGLDDARYGIPFVGEFHGHEEEEEDHLEEAQVDLDLRTHNLRLTGGFREIGSWVNGFTLNLNFVDYRHKELEISDAGTEVGTVFDNNLFVYRGVFDQQRRGILTGSFGFSGTVRSYDVQGEEALSPPIDHNNFALFMVEELDFEVARVQLGGRIEHSRYSPVAPALREEAVVQPPERSFTGFSGAAGVFVPTWKGGAFVTNYTHSYRAPALEELYNFGPHPGNLTFEIGDPQLSGERSNGLDFSLRHSSRRFRASANLFAYFFRDFIFLAPTGEIEEGLVAAEYSQGDSRYSGGEIELDLALVDQLWLSAGMEAVSAELRESDTPLPRIPPLKGRLGLDWRYHGFSVRPEIVLARHQERLFPTETRTAGYGVFNLNASYLIPRQHFVHVLSLNAFNLGDRLYRNHLSFIKDFAPEIGRGVRLTYTVQFF